MKRLLVTLCLLTLLCGCDSNSKDDFTTLDKKEKTLEQVMKENNYIIVDVRTKEEYDEGHVVSSINLPYDEIDENISLDKEKTIIVYCRSGNRSGIAYNILTELGYDVLDLGAYDSIELKKE